MDVSAVFARERAAHRIAQRKVKLCRAALRQTEERIERHEADLMEIVSKRDELANRLATNPLSREAWHQLSALEQAASTLEERRASLLQGAAEQHSASQRVAQEASRLSEATSQIGNECIDLLQELQRSNQAHAEGLERDTAQREQLDLIQAMISRERQQIAYLVAVRRRAEDRALGLQAVLDDELKPQVRDLEARLARTRATLGEGGSEENENGSDCVAALTALAPRLVGAFSSEQVALLERDPGGHHEWLGDGLWRLRLPRPLEAGAGTDERAELRALLRKEICARGVSWAKDKDKALDELALGWVASELEADAVRFREESRSREAIEELIQAASAEEALVAALRSQLSACGAPLA